MFDIETISDVVMHVRYTAALGATERAIPRECGILLDLRGDFSVEWQHFIDQTPVDDKRTLEFELTKDCLPFYAKNKASTVKGIDLVVVDGEDGVVHPPNGGAVLGTWRVDLPASEIQSAFLAILLEVAS
jgi:hypothetical protein